MKFRLPIAVVGVAAFLAVRISAGESMRPRIISLYAGHTEVLLRLGARDNIVGVSRQENYDGPETEGWSPPEFSIRDDIEKFLAAKPDIVLVRPQHVAGAGRLVDALERSGIAVVPLQVLRADELHAYWRELGGLVGRQNEAAAMSEAFAKEAARYAEASAKLERRPGVFIEAIHREVKTFVPGSIPAWLVGLAGGRYVAADAIPAAPGVIIADYGPERLLGKAGEIEVFVSQDGAMNGTPLETIRTRSIYQPLAAFKTGKVFKISEAILARPTPSLLKGLAQLAEWTGLARSIE
ncbi:MAG: ABC transporter substrate-binding protein [Planctomycetota bacterium]|nr:ABC transporter substrate-binding protein [Planctomycetota bacterium]